MIWLLSSIPKRVVSTHSSQASEDPADIPTVGRLHQHASLLLLLQAVRHCEADQCARGWRLRAIGSAAAGVQDRLWLPLPAAQWHPEHRSLTCGHGAALLSASQAGQKPWTVLRGGTQCSNIAVACCAHLTIWPDCAPCQAKTPGFKARIAAGESLDALVPEAFAVVREASRRLLGMRHFDVQLVSAAKAQDKSSELQPCCC